MIDNPIQVERLIPKLDESLPVFAGLNAELAALVREQAPGIEVPQRCRVTRIDYAGDAGGIMCRFDLCHGDDSKSVRRIHHTLDLRPQSAIGARDRSLSEASRQTGASIAVLLTKTAKEAAFG